MDKAIHSIRNQAKQNVNLPACQRGVLTTFTGVLILVLLTLMMFFAVRVGMFEQRVSSNDARQNSEAHRSPRGEIESPEDVECDVGMDSISEGLRETERAPQAQHRHQATNPV